MSFGKGVNDYLNHYVLLADGKAALLMAAAVGVLAVLLTTNVPLDDFFRAASAVAAIGALGLAGAVVYPRTPSSGVGVIFWADIRAYGDIDSYLSALAAKSPQDLERAYAVQNFHVSGVLLSKNMFVRFALWAFFCSIILAAVALLRAP